MELISEKDHNVGAETVLSGKLWSKLHFCRVAYHFVRSAKQNYLGTAKQSSALLNF